MIDGPRTRQLRSALAVGVLICAGSAEVAASCGDYLFTRHSRPARDGMRTTQPTAPITGTPADHAPQTAGRLASMVSEPQSILQRSDLPVPAPTRGCSGPGCRRSQSPATQLRVGGHLPVRSTTCSRVAALNLTPPEADFGLAYDAGHRQAGFRPRIDRPPQTGTAVCRL